MYIPPTRETEGEKKRQRKKILDLGKWPCSRADIILGDVNAHSPIWDNACLERPGLQDERGEQIEEWLMETPKYSLMMDGQQRTHLDTDPDLSILHAILVVLRMCT